MHVQLDNTGIIVYIQINIMAFGRHIYPERCLKHQSKTVGRKYTVALFKI